MKRAIRSCRCGTAGGKQRTFREHDDESYEVQVLQRPPDRSVVQMPDGHGAELRGYAPFHFHF